MGGDQPPKDGIKDNPHRAPAQNLDLIISQAWISSAVASQR
jgi:hypothetical protein